MTVSIIEHYLKSNKKHPKIIHFIQAGNMTHAYNEDAIILNRLFGYEVTLQGGGGEPYVKTAFKTTTINQVISTLKEKSRLMSFVHEKDDSEPSGYKKIKEVTFSNYISKQEFVDESDVIAEIQKKTDYKLHEETRLLQGFKDKKNDRFQLHHKAAKLQIWFNLCVSKYMPKIFRTSYGVQLTTLWIDLIKSLNKLRNIPNQIKEIIKEYQRTKERIFFEISVALDTLKDIIDAIWGIKGWKNTRQYRFVRMRVDELGRMTNGLIVKNDNSKEVLSYATN